MASHAQENVRVPVELRDRLENSKESVAILMRGIRGGAHMVRFSVCGGDTHSRLLDTSKALSNVCTKLALLFSRPPPPSLAECGSLCAQLDQATLSFVNAYGGVARVEQGVVYCEEVRGCVVSVLTDLDHLLSTIMADGCSQSAAQLHKTGSLWRSCEAVGKLSRDNLAASLKVYFSQLHLLRDALTEVTELESNNGVSEMELWDEMNDDSEITEVAETLGGVSLDDQESRGWSDEEMKLIHPSCQLIKLTVEVTECASRLLVRGGSVTSEGGVAEMGSGCDLVQKLSPAIDDLVSEMAVPVVMETCQSHALKLGETLLGLVETLSTHHYCQAERWPRDKFTATVKSLIQQLQ